jgi:hypothetical protein
LDVGWDLQEWSSLLGCYYDADWGASNSQMPNFCSDGQKAPR